MANALTINYRTSSTLLKFHQSNAFYRGVLGPVGSGKSTGMCMEIWRRSLEQAPGPDGIRRTRWGIVRNTYQELKDSSVKTWLQWFPEDQFGKFNQTSMDHRIRFKGGDMEVMFRALDRIQDVKRLLSTEFTGIWVNEAREIPKGIIDAAGDRVGRYPAIREGGCTWRGVMMDTNAPDDDSWWYKLAEESHEELAGQWEFFKQPGGLIEKEGQFLPNPLAENLKNLEPDYYQTRAVGKSLQHIRIYYCAQYGFVVEGRPVIPEYYDNLHCAASPLKPLPGLPIRIGLDFGLTPAAVFGQQLALGRWIWFDECTTEHMGAKNFAENVLIPKIREYADFEFSDTIHGDPAGNAEAQTDEVTPFQILNACLQNAQIPIKAVPAPSNDFTLRREALANCLTRLIDGKPGLIISPALKITRKGLAGGYCYKRLQVTGEDRYQERPDKNKFSHPVEAGEYMLLGAGEGVSLVRAAARTKKAPEKKRQAPAGGWMV